MTPGEILGVQDSVTGAGTPCVPLLEREIVSGELFSLLVIVTLPVTFKFNSGRKVTSIDVEPPGANISPDAKPLGVKPAPDTITFDIVTLEFPVFVTVSV